MDRNQTAQAGKTFIALLTAEASIPEEPGAVVPHAEI
jgi:hypothetical protein